MFVVVVGQVFVVVVGDLHGYLFVLVCYLLSETGKLSMWVGHEAIIVVVS